jgi:hypothetical protein
VLHAKPSVFSKDKKLSTAELAQALPARFTLPVTLAPLQALKLLAGVLAATARVMHDRS